MDKKIVHCDICLCYIDVINTQRADTPFLENIYQVQYISLIETCRSYKQLKSDVKTSKPGTARFHAVHFTGQWPNVPNTGSVVIGDSLHVVGNLFGDTCGCPF